MSQGTPEQERHPDCQEDERAPRVDGACILGVAKKTSRIIPSQEADYGDSSVPDQLCQDVGKDESCPVVCAAFALPSLVQSPLDDEHWDDLQDQGDHGEKEDKDSEGLVLQSLLRVVRHVEGKSDKKRLRWSVEFIAQGLVKGLTVPIVSRAFELIYAGERQYCWKVLFEAYLS